MKNGSQRRKEGRIDGGIVEGWMEEKQARKDGVVVKGKNRKVKQ